MNPFQKSPSIDVIPVTWRDHGGREQTLKEQSLLHRCVCVGCQLKRDFDQAALRLKLLCSKGHIRARCSTLTTPVDSGNKQVHTCILRLKLRVLFVKEFRNKKNAQIPQKMFYLACC